ncbi:MAG: HD domain-containing phosphohydrolase [Alphaproteobacteria bacterium]
MTSPSASDRADSWLGDLPLGVLAFDAADRLTIANAAAKNLLGTAATIGSSYRATLAAWAGSGALDLGDVTAEAWVEGHAGRQDGAAAMWEVRLRDGRTVRVDERRLGDGSRTCAIVDVTELREGEQQMMRLASIGVALSAENDVNALLEIILLEAKAITNADGGTIYLMGESPPEGRPEGIIDRRAGGDRRHRERRRLAGSPPAGTAERRSGRDLRGGRDRRRSRKRLEFAIVRNDSLGIALGGTTGAPIEFPAMTLYDPVTGAPNSANVATYAANTRRSVNIADAYNAEGFDFSGTHRFDRMNRYRSTSFLTIPMSNSVDEVIGVLQLINCRDRATKTVSVFSPRHQQLVESLASQAAVALDNALLIGGQKRLFESFIKLIATAIDEKSPYTGGHCERVPALTEMIAEAVCQVTDGPFQYFDLTPQEQFELHVAGWLHDCGKITSPEHIIDKATKLETIFDRIHAVDARFEVLKRDAEIAYLRGMAEAGAGSNALKAAYEARLAALDDDRAFLREINFGGEFLDAAKAERIKRIAAERWRGPDGTEQDFLTENEAYNLAISRGTLTAEERKVMNEHMTVTIQMLEKLPFPPGLRRVPEFAGGHHEKMDGTGFPRRLKREQMSIPARIMAIADIFEALTAADRPYKKPKKLSESMAIMAHMRDSNHIDPELFQLFVETGVYRRYAERFLKPEQIDEVDVTRVLARKPKGA